MPNTNTPAQTPAHTPDHTPAGIPGGELAPPSAPAYTIHPQVAATVIDGCQVLLLAARGEVLVLNPTATIAWAAIAAAPSPPTLAALAATLAAHCTVTPAAAAADLAPLLHTLVAAHALTPQ